ncbi:DrmB family protein [Streptomyces sp. NPDC050418]|uniref:DrmB family protein n=1 Tax=Streptomyces sp. NPDC050418 TaxID=3365612 RepID=UPI0037AFF502
MTPPRQRRTAGTFGAPRQALSRKGAVRRAQAVTTYGVGSLVAFEQESFIVSGLDGAEASWSEEEAPKVYEHRLARTLGVSHFRLPPGSDDRSSDGMRVRRFPLMHSCPGCEKLQPIARFNPPAGKATCEDCAKDLVPSRFVVACEKGHLDDFPYWKWLHRDNRAGGGAGACGGTLKLRSTGRTASLRSIVISCTCGTARDVSMEGAFGRRALAELRIPCEGKSPWLKDAPADASCTATPRTLQRGASSVWQPVLKSALSIPPWSDGSTDPLAEIWDQLRECESEREISLVLNGKFNGNPPITAARVMELLVAETQDDPEPESEEAQAPDAPYLVLLRQEYRKLAEGNPEQADRHEQFVCEPPEDDHHEYLDRFGLDRPMLVKRLREVRALKGFTRIVQADAAPDSDGAPLSRHPLNWLPAMEVSGEGVFLRFDQGRLDTWAAGKKVQRRVARMSRNHDEALVKAAPKGATARRSPGTPRMVLLHTLAHALINEWSLEAGYPAAALRERLYADDTMAGCLIYTATSDSAGSLGGLVAQGEPKALQASLWSALRRACWCSADPLCIESGPSGTDGTNLAACHACAMLPETSCEHNNMLLDRALLVGTPEEPSLGFFQDLMES